MNTPVNFEIAKLLKEKKYGNKTPHQLSRNYYTHLGELNGDVIDYIKALVNKEELTHLEPIDAPTIADVVMWLCEKRHIDSCHIVNYTNDIRTYRIGIVYVKDKLVESVFIRPENNKFLFVEFNSVTEAYEAAIAYVLINLI